MNDSTRTMQQVFARIDELGTIYQGHRLWHMLKSGDGAAAALRKLRAFAPAISHFILGFRDFNDFVLPYQNPQTPLEHAINNHAVEDSTHFRPFIEDWEKLGGNVLLQPYEHLIPGLSQEDHRLESAHTIASLRQDGHVEGGGVPMLSLSGQVLSFLWSDAANRHNRKLLHHYSRLIHQHGADPVVRFAIIEAGEATGLVMFHITAALANELSADNGIEYRYFGEYHLALETGHLVNQETTPPVDEGFHLSCSCEADEPFKQLTLTEAQYQQSMAMVDEVFAQFTEWLDGIVQVMQQFEPVKSA
jgi:hypothetical protein